jgi:outer membrane autotransporter protein
MQDNRSNVWGLIAASRDNASSDGNGPGFESRSTDFQLGVDKALNVNTRIGVAVGTGNGRVDISERAARGDLDTDSIGVSLSHRKRDVYADAALSLSRHKIESRRELLAGGTATGDAKARSVVLSGEVGKTMTRGGAVVEPNFTFRLSNTHQDGFDENGGVDSLSVGDSRLNSRRLGVGVRVRSADESASFRPYASLSYEREMGDVTASLSNALDGLNSFEVRGTELGRNIFTLRTGADAKLSEKLSFVGEIAFSKRDNADSRSIYGGLKYVW